MGFSLHNTIAVLEGHIGKKSEFVRTQIQYQIIKRQLEKQQHIRKKPLKCHYKTSNDVLRFWHV